jgi:hypothetical protein
VLLSYWYGFLVSLSPALWVRAPNWLLFGPAGGTRQLNSSPASIPAVGFADIAAGQNPRAGIWLRVLRPAGSRRSLFDLVSPSLVFLGTRSTFAFLSSPTGLATWLFVLLDSSA